MKSYLKSLGSFEGRISRSIFWVNSIIGIILPTVLLIVLSIFGMAVLTPFALSNNHTGLETITSSIAIIISVVAIASGIVVSFSAMVRRFHDRNKSGWLVLISLIPVACPIWILVECGFLKGTDGGNQYGDDSRASQENNNQVIIPVQPAV